MYVCCRIKFDILITHVNKDDELDRQASVIVNQATQKALTKHT